MDAVREIRLALAGGFAALPLAAPATATEEGAAPGVSVMVFARSCQCRTAAEGVVPLALASLLLALLALPPSVLLRLLLLAVRACPLACGLASAEPSTAPSGAACAPAADRGDAMPDCSLPGATVSVPVASLSELAADGGDKLANCSDDDAPKPAEGPDGSDDAG